MAIQSIDIFNVMVFQRQFYLDFCSGINVLIGENGVGKTTILKMIYAATQWSNEKTNPGKTKQLTDFFSNSLKDSSILKNAGRREENCYYKVSDGEHVFENHLPQNAVFNFDDWLGLNIPSVFIPSMEMLSHSKGFLAMNQKYTMPFDGTQTDIIVNASLPETREVSKLCGVLLKEISDAIEGVVVQENDIFYVMKNDGTKVDFSLEAEGLRKLGLLWKLIRNGLLEKGTILLWDEPEANLNPELYPLVVNVLLGLQKNGVQVFIATHSYNFAKYLEIRREKKEQVMFYNLYKAKDAIFCISAYKMEDLGKNPIMSADDQLLDEVYGL